MKPIRILISGPESTGKSELAVALAAHYQGSYIPEYARKYLEDSGKPYGYEDVEHIALQQLEEYTGSARNEGFVFFDTWLIITKVWFEEVFHTFPGWLHDHIRDARFDLVLVCAPDLPWIPDPLRENGGRRRDQLFERYKAVLTQYEMNWQIVSGTGDQRTFNAIQLIDKHLTHDTI